MSSIQWNPRYATGIPEIDAQHKNLVEVIHKLRQALEKGHPHAETMEIMQFLLGYVDEHFTLEEAYMEHIGYPGLPQHRKLHEQLRMQVYALNDRLAHDEPGSAMELSLLLFHWLMDHILHDDNSYVAHAKERKKLST